MLHQRGKVAYAQGVGLVDLPGSGKLLAADDLEYGGFARAVLADKTYLVSLADMEIDLVQQDKPAVGDGDIVNTSPRK